MTIRLVVFDVGETLVDESRMWGEWADWLGVTRLAFFAALGAVIAAAASITARSTGWSAPASTSPASAPPAATG